MNESYVYLHYEDSEVVYIGKGVGGRAWDCYRRKGESGHMEWMRKQMPFLKVEIYASGLTHSDARKTESELIVKHQPKFNLIGTNDYIPKNLRHVKGEKSPLSKLTDEQAKEIKTRAANGERVKDFKNDYPVNEPTLYDIVAGRSWKHIEVE